MQKIKPSARLLIFFCTFSLVFNYILLFYFITNVKLFQYPIYKRLNPQTYKIRRFCLAGAEVGRFIAYTRKNALKTAEISGKRAKTSRLGHIKQNSIAETQSTMESFLGAQRGFELPGRRRVSFWAPRRLGFKTRTLGDTVCTTPQALPNYLRRIWLRSPRRNIAAVIMTSPTASVLKRKSTNSSPHGATEWKPSPYPSAVCLPSLKNLKHRPSSLMKSCGTLWSTA